MYNFKYLFFIFAFPIFFIGCSTNECSGGPSAAGSWTWYLGFKGFVKQTVDSATVSGANVVINQKYSGRTDSNGYYSIQSTSCNEKQIKSISLISIVVSKNGYANFSKTVPRDSVGSSPLGNDSHSSGTQFNLPTAFLSK
jgi:hypothetical protein